MVGHKDIDDDERPPKRSKLTHDQNVPQVEPDYIPGDEAEETDDPEEIAFTQEIFEQLEAADDQQINKIDHAYFDSFQPGYQFCPFDHEIDHAYFDSFPPGYRFCPFDHELLVHYLKKKVLDQPLPKNRIMDVKLYEHNPESLAENYKAYGGKEWYFFTSRAKKYKNGSRPSRSTPDGYWKATGADKPIKYKGDIVGFRKALVFYVGKAPQGDKTNWLMHEFRMKDSSNNNRKDRKGGDDDMTLDKWVLCRIYKKTEKPSASRDEDRDQLQLQGQSDDDMGHYEYATADTASATDDHYPLILENGANQLFGHDDQLIRQVHPLVSVEDPSHSQWVSPAVPMNMIGYGGTNKQFTPSYQICVYQLPPLHPHPHPQSYRSSSWRPSTLYPTDEYNQQAAHYKSRILQDPTLYPSSSQVASQKLDPPPPPPQNYDNNNIIVPASKLYHPPENDNNTLPTFPTTNLNPPPQNYVPTTNISPAPSPNNLHTPNGGWDYYHD